MHCPTPASPHPPLCLPPAAPPPPRPQIARRRKAHQEANPEAKIISLGIGDTTEPIPPFIADAMQAASQGLGTPEGYSGCVGAPSLGADSRAGLARGSWEAADGLACGLLVCRFGARAAVASQRRGGMGRPGWRDRGCVPLPSRPSPASLAAAG